MRYHDSSSTAAALVLAAVAWLPAARAVSAQETDPLPTRAAGVTVRGEVVAHESGEAVSGAAVSLGPGPGGTEGVGTRVTDDAGRFLFRSVPAGSYRLSVVMLGYRSMADTVVVPPDADLELVLPLSTAPVPLDPIVVATERGVPGGFTDPPSGRSRHFLITREEIERRHPTRLSDLLTMVPGGRLVPARGFGRLLLLRGGCRPAVWIDRVEVAGYQSLDELVSPGAVAAIEIYHGNDLPVELGSHPCGGIVVWTRTGTPRAEGDDTGTGFWHRFGIASGILLLVFLVTR